MPFRATTAANWSSIIRIGAKMAVIRRRIARRAVSNHTQRAGRVPYGESRLKPSFGKVVILMNSDPPSEFNRREVQESSPWTLIRSDPFSVSNVVRVLWQHYVVPRISRWPVWLQGSVVVIVIGACISAVVVPTFFSNDKKPNGEDENAISKCGFAFDGFNSHQSVKNALERLAISHFHDEITGRSENNLQTQEPPRVLGDTLISNLIPQSIAGSLI